MTETWAEGSGSTWESLEGDPRIVPGAEVLVGWRRGSSPYFDHMDRFVGRRGVVGGRRRSAGYTEVFDLWWCPRDLVCLRLASGELTEEGRALEWLLSRVDIAGAVWQSHDWTDEQTSPGMGVWLARAGITAVKIGEPRYFGVDPRRLAMALGREEKPSGVETLPPYHGHPLHIPGSGLDLPMMPCAAAPPPAPVMCSRCGVQPARSVEGAICCADCAQIVSDEVRAERAWMPPTPPVDLSGEQHLDALRDWLRRPMGTR